MRDLIDRQAAIEAPKPITNADRIRAMTDEELAEWIIKHDCHINLYGYDPKDAVLDWLKQEVKEEQAERMKGKWVFDYNNPYRRCKARCSICGKYSGIGGIRSNQLKPFCPNCGARMEEQE